MPDSKPLDNSTGVDLLLITGRIVRVNQERATDFLINRRFILFLLATFALSFGFFAVLSGGNLQLQQKAVGWFIGCGLVVLSVYCILFVLMNYVLDGKATIILTPVLSATAVALATPILVAYLIRWVPPGELRAVTASFFFGGLLSAECAFVVFVHFVRDPIVRQFEEEMRRMNAEPSSAVRIGPEVFPLDTLCYIEADNQYVKVHLTNSNVLIAGQLTNVERQLSGDVVFRPHRSYLVFRHGIAAVQVDEAGLFSIQTKSGQDLPVARRRVAQLREWLADSKIPGSEPL